MACSSSEAGKKVSMVVRFGNLADRKTETVLDSAMGDFPTERVRNASCHFPSKGVVNARMSGNVGKGISPSITAPNATNSGQ